MKNKKGCGCKETQNKTNSEAQNETQNAKNCSAKKSANTKNCG